MTTFITSVISGLGTGAVYGVLAVSFVIIFRATGVLNFAQPGLLIIGVFFCSYFAVGAVAVRSATSAPSVCANRTV